MPDVVCSVCGVYDVSGHSGLGPDWRQCQWNINGRINDDAFMCSTLEFDDGALSHASM